MNPTEIAFRYFNEGRVMQIATLHDGHPRVNSVYYVMSDDNKSVYWMSESRRRHSRDILADNRTGGAIAIKLDSPVAGLQFTGSAFIIKDDEELKEIIAKYNAKYDNVADGLYEKILAETNKHSVYKISITELELFDEVNFPSGDVISVPLENRV
jgi:uncharacterized protein YhbP (UPF0306 family)